MIENCGKDVIPVKLPSGLTDILQPLDVGVFGPLKKTWNDYLRDSRLTIGIDVRTALYFYTESVDVLVYR